MSAPTAPAHAEQISATTDVLVAVDKPYSSETLESRLWERRDFLRRLVRSDAPG
jgi:hypothetical protein